MVRVKKCLNCNFIFVDGEKIPTRGANHPNAYYNPCSPVPFTPYVSEVCPKCGSNAIVEKVELAV